MRMRSTRSGQTFSAPVVMTSSMRPETTSFPSGVEAAGVTGGEPVRGSVGAVDAPVVPVPVAAEEHGGPEEDLSHCRPDRSSPAPPLHPGARSRRGAEGDLHPIEGVSVVDHAGPRLGHAVGGDDVVRQRVGSLAAAEEDTGEDRGVEPSQRGGDEGDVRGPARAPGLLDRLCLEPGQDDDGGPGHDRTCDDGQAPDVRERQAGQPHVAGGIDAEPCRGRPRRRGNGVVGEDDTFGIARRARCRHHERVALLDGDAVGERMLLAVRADDPRGAQRVEHHVARGEREPWVEGSGGIAGVPDGLEGIDEADATGKVECDELRHRPVA